MHGVTPPHNNSKRKGQRTGFALLLAHSLFLTLTNEQRFLHKNIRFAKMIELATRREANCVDENHVGTQKSSQNKNQVQSLSGLATPALDSSAFFFFAPLFLCYWFICFCFLFCFLFHDFFLLYYFGFVRS